MSGVGPQFAFPSAPAGTAIVYFEGKGSIGRSAARAGGHARRERTGRRKMCRVHGFSWFLRAPLPCGLGGLNRSFLRVLYHAIFPKGHISGPVAAW